MDYEERYLLIHDKEFKDFMANGEEILLALKGLVIGLLQQYWLRFLTGVVKVHCQVETYTTARLAKILSAIEDREVFYGAVVDACIEFRKLYVDEAFAIAWLGFVHSDEVLRQSIDQLVLLDMDPRMEVDRQILNTLRTAHHNVASDGTPSDGMPLEIERMAQKLVGLPVRHICMCDSEGTIQGHKLLPN